MGLLRGLAIFKLGVFVGAAATAALVKRVVPSRGDEESDEVALVAMFDGIELESRARAFRGGSMLACFGGIEFDLADAELAPEGARLSLHALLGGIEITVPPGWKVESDVKAVLGGVQTPVPTEGEDESAPVLPVTGTALLGGILIRSSADVAGETPVASA
jgi:hypothetical protein